MCLLSFVLYVLCMIPNVEHLISDLLFDNDKSTSFIAIGWNKSDLGLNLHLFFDYGSSDDSGKSTHLHRLHCVTL